ncbi:hypothetical protein PSV08DRAFT_289925, partial [Bipolaris maydis]|uniref:uncharacterized protein n=1 Tax=Cochliobolus heterostrophus TaxID=5016 RepID=UPI0024D60963
MLRSLGARQSLGNLSLVPRPQTIPSTLPAATLVARYTVLSANCPALISSAT